MENGDETALLTETMKYLHHPNKGSMSMPPTGMENERKSVVVRHGIASSCHYNFLK